MISLSDIILQKNVGAVAQALPYAQDINLHDQYGFTPLIEAAIIDHTEIAKMLLEYRASANVPDVTGGTALHWAVENNNLELCRLLLAHGANPNASNFAGQPVLVMPLLRDQAELKALLVSAGADIQFAHDYINTKLLGHIFEIVGMATILSPDNQYVEVDFEGFYLEVTLGLIADSVRRFQNHFAARKLRRYSGVSNFIVEVINRAGKLIKFQQYRVDRSKHRSAIKKTVMKDPLVIPVGYEGHAITFIRYGNLWVKCDRREDSRLYDNVMIYQVTRLEQLTPEFIQDLIYKKQSSEFINKELDHILGLQPLTEIKVDAQISGNCSWANVEAIIPALFFLVMMELSKGDETQAYNKTLALNYFHRWRDWSKDRLLHYFIQRFEEGDEARKSCIAEMLVALLFQRCDINEPNDYDRIETILTLILQSPYEYLLKNYLRVYYYESNTEEGKKFAEMLKAYGYKV